jgi:Tfp pilus assembly ATPase PilU
MKDLLTLVTSEHAEELLVDVGCPPVVLLGGGEHTIEGPVVTRENAAQLFQALADAEQVRELDRCGDVKFIFSPNRSERFAVAASLRHDNINLQIRNLCLYDGQDDGQ